jgi:AraC-like DNA-binding protein
MVRRNDKCSPLGLLSAEHGLELLFDYLPDVYLFVKDATGRFVHCNRAFVGLVRAKSEEEVLGRHDTDFFPGDLCESYLRDDRAVMASGLPLVDKIELVRNSDWTIDWHSTTKLPLLDGRQHVIGVAGITRDVKKTNAIRARYLSMAPALDAIMTDYAGPLSVAALAVKVSLSVSQFERQFKKKFQTTPLKYIARIRIEAACRLLVSTDQSISAIALQTGFYDQSHFTNQFVRLKGTTPSLYRKEYGPGTADDDTSV